jgi:hypothetical protein
VNVLEFVNGSIDHYMSKLPRWANQLVGLWLLFAGAVYFGLIELPDIGWWRPVVMAPVIILLLAALLHIAVLMVSWVISPIRWLARKLSAKSHG